MLRPKKAFSLLEAIFAIVIIATILVPSITAIQSSRVRMRSTSQQLVGEHLAVSVMEMVKRSGFGDYEYGDALVEVSQSLTSPILEFPRNEAPMEDAADVLNVLPQGPPGGVTDNEFARFVSDYRSGGRTIQELAENPAVTSDTNYYFYNKDQIAAFNGYGSWDAIPAEDDPGTPENEDKTQSLLNPTYAWGYYSQVNTGPDGLDDTTDDLRHVAVIVKWIDTRTGRRQFTVLESWVTFKAPRLSKP